MVDLSDLPFFLLVPYLDGTDLLALRCVSAKLRNILSREEDEIWSTLLERDFQYRGRRALRIRERRLGPSIFGTTASEAVVEMDSAFETWRQWKRSTRRFTHSIASAQQQEYPPAEHPPSPAAPTDFRLKAEYFLRAAEIWARLETWLVALEPQHSSFASNLRSSLKEGKAYRDLKWSLEILNQPAVGPTQALLAFYGGQQIGARSPFRGLLGGFSAYDYLTCTAFVEGLEQQNVLLIGFCPLSLRMGRRKMIHIDPSTGRVEYDLSDYGGADNEQRQRWPCCPSRREDAVLDWMGEYVRRLETGYYGIGPLMKMIGESSILQYPCSGPETSRAVTRGVEVVASAVYSPWTERGRGAGGFAFCYSIRLTLLRPGQDGHDPNRGFESCQLRSRHWRLTHRETNQIEHVDGDGVVGNYPLLMEGSYRNDTGRSSRQLVMGGGGGQIETDTNGTFVYQSCCDSSSSMFAGYLMFVPGSLTDPKGEAFRVDVGPFPLNNDPEYIY